MIKKTINEIKVEWRKNPISTGFMGIVILFAFLSYIKPTSTSGILGYIGVSINLLTFVAVLVLFYFFYWRKR